MAADSNCLCDKTLDKGTEWLRDNPLTCDGIKNYQGEFPETCTNCPLGQVINNGKTMT